MMMMSRNNMLSGTLALLFASAVAILGGCIFIFRTVDVESVDPERGPIGISTPLKVHLVDGTIGLFPFGGTFADDSLKGRGRKYSVGLQDEGSLSGVALQEVAAVETYDERVLGGPTAAVSLLATAGGVVGFKALFGSCPTIYSTVDGELLLEAESFSNSIAPLLELRDVDRIHVLPDALGQIELEVRNEALETHYINHLELVEVTHMPGAFVVPAELGKSLVLHNVVSASSMFVRDRGGRDVSFTLSAVDGDAYSTDAGVLDAVNQDDIRDHIDLVLPQPARDTVAVLLRLRNSLLNTVLFYDYMLKGQGPRALEWLHKDLNNVGSAIELGDFYRRHMRLRVQVREGETFREVGHVREVGPIAWSDVAVPVPVPKGDSLRIRLSFIADAWRIDRAAVALDVRGGASIRRIPVHRLLDSNRKENADAHARIARPDEDYLVTFPGERFWIQFAADPIGSDVGRTFFIASQGYYTEWIRGEWLREAGDPSPFEASKETLLAVIQRWKKVMPEYEARFESTRIPVK